MNPNLVANVTLAGAAALCLVPGIQMIESGNYIGGPILLGASIVFFVMYELFPDSNKPNPPVTPPTT